MLAITYIMICQYFFEVEKHIYLNGLEGDSSDSKKKETNRKNSTLNCAQVAIKVNSAA